MDLELQVGEIIKINNLYGVVCGIDNVGQTLWLRKIDTIGLLRYVQIENSSYNNFHCAFLD